MSLEITNTSINTEQMNTRTSKVTRQEKHHLEPLITTLPTLQVKDINDVISVITVLLECLQPLNLRLLYNQLFINTHILKLKIQSVKICKMESRNDYLTSWSLGQEAMMQQISK